MQALLELADELHVKGRAGGDSVDYAAFEERVAEATADLEKGVHQVALRSLDIDAPYIRVWGKYYRRVHRAERAFGTMGGPVTIQRTLYREVGKRRGAAVDPVALRAGAVDGSWLPRTSRAIAHLMAQGTSREASATSTELLRLPYSRSSFERVGHAVGREYLRRRAHIEPKLIAEFDVPKAARSISVSVDRTTVPMEEVPEKREAPAPMPITTPPLAAATSETLDRRLMAVRGRPM